MNSFKSEELQDFIYDYIEILGNLITFLDDNGFDIKFIGFVIELKDRWEEAFDIICFKDCNDECLDLSKNFTLDNLLEDTRNLYKEVGKRLYERIKRHEIIRNKLKFQREYLSVMNSINKYFD